MTYFRAEEACPLNPIFWFLLCLVPVAQGFVVALLLVPLAGRLGLRWGMADLPGPRKIHTHPMPRSGGLAVFATFMGCLALDLLAAWWIGRHASFLPEPIRALCGNIPMRLTPLLGIVIGATMVFAVGVVDDRHALRPRVKLAVQALAVIPLILGGVTIQLFLPAPWLGWIITGLWVILLTNSFNLLDNMDGLCSGVGAIICGVLLLISLFSGEYYMGFVFALLGGTLLGFVRYNFHPARIFLGDSGSLTIGFLIASLTTVATYYHSGVPTGLPVLMPLIVLGVPLFDTISVMLLRWRMGKPLLVGDTNHFSHRLVRLGMKQPRAVVFIYLTTLAVGLAALPLRYLPLSAALTQTVLIALLFVLIYLLERTGRMKDNGERRGKQD